MASPSSDAQVTNVNKINASLRPMHMGFTVHAKYRVLERVWSETNALKN